MEKEEKRARSSGPLNAGWTYGEGYKRRQRKDGNENRSSVGGDTVIEAEEGIVKGNAIILKDTCDAVRQFSPSDLQKGNFLHRRFS